MYLSEIFQQLTVGELSQINIGGGEQGEISPDDYLKIIPHVNLALTRLHSRFLLQIGRLEIDLLPGRYEYPLKEAYAASNPRAVGDSIFIQDSLGEKFEDTILKIEGIELPTGIELSLRNRSDPFTVWTPNMYTLQIPKRIVDKDMNLHEDLKVDKLTVVYRANHRKISEDNDGDYPEDFHVDLPYSHLQALLYFVASRIHNPTGMVNEFHMGNSFYAKYENECARLENEGMQVDSGIGHDRFRSNGWV